METKLNINAIEDGSIGVSKLSQELQDSIGSIPEIQEALIDLGYKNSSDYCVSAWDNDSLDPECIETYGSKDFCDQWDFYLIDTTQNDQDTIEPVGKLMRNNLFRFEDGSWAPVVGILEERKAECDVALYLKEIPEGETEEVLTLYCSENSFNPIEFYETYGMNTKLYNSEGIEVNILRPWETTETKYTICLARNKDIYLLDNVIGKSGKRWKGIFSKPITWDGIDISPYKLKPTGISPGPATVIDDNGVPKLRNFFYLYEGSSCCHGSSGTNDVECTIFKGDRTWPVSYDYESSNGYKISQPNNMIWARNNNSDITSPVPFAEGGFFALNSYLTSYEVMYGTKYLHNANLFSGGIYSATNTNEASWLENGNIRIKESNSEDDWTYRSWGSTVQSLGFYTKSDASDTSTTWSTAVNRQLPKELCMESQIVSSYISELGIEENVRFELYGNTYWYKNVPGTIGLNDGKMNVIVYKLITGNITLYKYDVDETTVIPITLDIEIILKVGLVNGANLGGDVFMYWGGGYELVGTTNRIDAASSGDFPVKIYLEPDQSNWLFEKTNKKSDLGIFDFETKYPILTETTNLAGESYVKERIPYTGVSTLKGGTSATGDCHYCWSGNHWGYSVLNERTRIGARFRYYAHYGSNGFRTSACYYSTGHSFPFYSASAQISLRFPLQA